MRTEALGCVLVALLVVGLTAPVAAVSTADGVTAADTNAATADATTAQANTTQGNSSVNVTVGQQLSTVIGVSSDEVQTDFEDTAFEISVENAGQELRAEAIANRADELSDRAENIRDEYEDATEAHREGEISTSAYARRLATLNGQATNLLDSHEQLRQRAQNVSALELRAAGVNQSALRETVENLSGVSGAGPAALLDQFTGQSVGDIELETAGGFSLEIESEDGEQSREIERPRDANPSVVVSQSAALETAREGLSTPENGTWTLTAAKLEQDAGAYEFAFVLRGATTRTGEAEIDVDGSSGAVFALEEELEPREEEREAEAEDEENEADDELAMLVSEGTPGPNATVTVTVLSDGTPVDDVTVFLNERVAGTTTADGTATVTLPESGEATLTARSGEAEGELEFEFEAEDDEVFRKLNVDAALADDTVSVTVAYNGSGVPNATVYANEQAVGTTGQDGAVRFAIDTNATEDLELEVIKGAFEAELEYVLQDGSLTLTETAHEGDGDKAEAREEAEEEREEEAEEEREEEAEEEREEELEEEHEEEAEEEREEEAEEEREEEAEEEREEELEEEREEEAEEEPEEEVETPDGEPPENEG
ncbi:DUF7096 domain-containing protein [Halorientalis sp.]|uniref:DUF7096 domain-containing protein n=1 Tax=Halorientalis sp. TaxID=1931229 RepID=UPI002605DA53|nr:hypothetical protein [Halorientalis sp.]